MLKISQREAFYLRSQGFSAYVKDNTNSRWHTYRVVESKKVLNFLYNYRKSCIIEEHTSK